MLPVVSVLFFAGVFLVDWKRTRLDLFSYFVVRAAFIYSRLWHRWHFNRLAPFPRAGPSLVVCNHTCSADPMFILGACRVPISFVVAREHYVMPFIHWVLSGIGSVPVRRGGMDPVALRNSLRALERGQTLCLYPEGNLSSVVRGRLGTAKPGIGYLALKTRLPVFPVYVHGGPRTDELLASWVYPTHRAATVFFGPPVDLSDFLERPLGRRVIEEATCRIMAQIDALRPRRQGPHGA
jgi:1-acyl-sn-glycerol-3-phosphate acyltransferase